MRFFVHVPKCGGTTIHNIHRSNNYNPEAFIHGADWIKSDGYTLKEFVSEQNGGVVDVVSGHFSCKEVATVIKDGDEVFTVLRDPWKQFRSRFNFYVKRLPMPMHKTSLLWQMFGSMMRVLWNRNDLQSCGKNIKIRVFDIERDSKEILKFVMNISASDDDDEHHQNSTTTTTTTTEEGDDMTKSAFDFQANVCPMGEKISKFMNTAVGSELFRLFVSFNADDLEFYHSETGIEPVGFDVMREMKEIWTREEFASWRQRTLKEYFDIEMSLEEAGDDTACEFIIRQHVRENFLLDFFKLGQMPLSARPGARRVFLRYDRFLSENTSV